MSTQEFIQQFIIQNPIPSRTPIDYIAQYTGYTGDDKKKAFQIFWDAAPVREAWAAFRRSKLATAVAEPQAAPALSPSLETVPEGGESTQSMAPHFAKGLDASNNNQCWFNSLFMALTIVLQDMQCPQASDRQLNLMQPVGEWWGSIVDALRERKPTADGKQKLLLGLQGITPMPPQFWTGGQQRDVSEAYLSLLSTQPNGSAIRENTAMEQKVTFNHAKCTNQTGGTWDADNLESLPLLNVALPTATGAKETLGLADLLAAHFKGEDVTVNCRQCNQTNATVKKSGVLVLAPALLVVNLNQFKHSRGGIPVSEKLQQPVHCPPSIQVPIRDEANNNAFADYELVAMINHSGGINNGHYVAVVRAKQAGKEPTWEVYNDARQVEIYKEERRVSKNTTFTPYLVLYRRVFKDRPWNGENQIVLTPQQRELRIARYRLDIKDAVILINSLIGMEQKQRTTIDGILKACEMNNNLPALQATPSATASTSLAAAASTDVDPNPFHAVEKKLDEYKSTLRNKIVNLDAPSHQVDGIALKAETFTAALLRQL